MTLLPTRLVNEHSANEATDTVTKALEGMKERAAALVPKPVYQPRQEEIPDVTSAPAPVMRAPVVEEPQAPELPHITLPSVQEIIGGNVGGEAGGPDASNAPAAGATQAPQAPSSYIGEEEPPSLQPIKLPSVHEITGIPPEPEPTMGAQPIAGTESVPSGAPEPVIRMPGAQQTPPAAPQAAAGAPQDIEGYIRQAAAKRGIDPDVAVKAANTEGGVTEPSKRGTFATGSSWWPFQLHYGGKGYEHLGTTAGMGNSFTAETGIQPGDPNGWRQSVDYALDAVAKNGWGAWYGPKTVGITGRVGVSPDARPIGVGAAPEASSTVQGGVATGAGTPMPAAGQSTSAAFDAQSVAKQWEGKKYVFGGAGGRGAGLADTDCSGFVAQLTGLPAHTDAAYQTLKQRGAGAIDESQAVPGDVVFYMGAGTGGTLVHHMGLYAGPGKVLDMSTAGSGGVNIRPISHGGAFEILRDPANAKTPDVPPTAAPPPEIVPTPVESGGEKPTQNQIDQWSQMATTMGDAADRIKGVPVAQAMRSGNVQAMQYPEAGDLDRGNNPTVKYPAIREDEGANQPLTPRLDEPAGDVRGTGSTTDYIPGYVEDNRGRPPIQYQQDMSAGGRPAGRDIGGDYGPADLRQGGEADTVQGAPDSYGAGQSGAGAGVNQPPARDIRGDYAPRATEPGDYPLAPQAAPPPAGPVAVEPVSSPTEAPASGDRPWHEQLASSIGSAVSNALQSAFGGQKPDLSVGAADIQNRATAEPTGPMPFDQIGQAVGQEAQHAGQYIGPGAEVSPSQRLAQAATPGITPEGTKRFWVDEPKRLSDLFGKQMDGTLTPEEDTELKDLQMRHGMAMGMDAPTIKAGSVGPGGVTRILGVPSEHVRPAAGAPEQGPSAGIVSRGQADEAAQQIAPPFYSQLQRTIEEKMPNRAGPGQIQGILRGSAVKPDEIKWTGLDEFLQSKGNQPVTKQEVLDHLKQNEVQVQEVVKGGRDRSVEMNATESLRRALRERGWNQAETDVVVSHPNRYTGNDPEIQGIVRDLIDAQSPVESPTKFGTYQLPGGENYRELLLTMPQKPSEQIRYAIKGADGINQPASALTRADAIAEAGGDPTRVVELRTATDATNYRSSHFDEPNILAHVRFNERTDAAGKRVLFVEEVQSDWHQAGRERGYIQPESAADWSVSSSNGRQHTVVRPDGSRFTEFADTPEEAIRTAMTRETPRRDGMVPDAPFQKTWPELAMKRTVRWAAENGFDRVAWTTGAQQAERYDLSKQIDRLQWSFKPGEADGTLYAYKDGRKVLDQVAKPEELPGIIGREASDKLLSQPGDGVNQFGFERKILEGIDLRAGGEGMQTFYDQMLPNVMNKLGKKFGARVGETEIPTQRITPQDTGIPRDRRGGTTPVEMGSETVHAIDITPAMKDAVMTQGQPLFFTPGDRPRPGMGASIARGAAQGGIAGGYAASQEEGATPQDVARGALLGASTGAVRGGLTRAVGPRGAGQIARMAQEASDQPERQGLPSGARPITLTTAEEKARLRVDKMVGDLPKDVQEDVGNILTTAAQDADWHRTQRRGVIPDDVADSMAADLESRVDEWVGDRGVGRAFNQEQIRALKNVTKTTGVKIHELTTEIDAARAAGSTPDLLIAERANASNLLYGIQQVAEGSRAEAGRALRAWKSDARLIRDDPQKAIARIYEKVGGRDEAAKIAEEFTKAVNDGADPIQMANIWAKVERGEIKTGERFALYRRFNMLSGPRTIEVNATGGALNQTYETLGALGESAVHGDIEGAATELVAPILALNRSSRGFMQTLAHGITKEAAERGDIPRSLSARATNPIDRASLTVQELPDRFNSAVDTFWRTQAEALGLAKESAQRTRHLKGQERAGAMADIVANPDQYPGVTDNVKRLADRVTLQGDMGATGRALEKFRETSPFVGNILIPFLRTIYHGTTQSIDKSPLGLLTTAQEAARGTYRAGKDLPAGVPELPTRIRDNVAGTLAYAWAYDQAKQGNITGQGPDDPTERAALRDTGWRPYSIKVGNEYHSYANFMPFTLPLSMAAAAAESEKYKKDKATTGDVIANGVKRTVGVIGDMSVVAGMGAVFKSIEDPERYGGQWLTQTLQTLIPAGSALNTVGQATDPLERRPLPGSDFATRLSQGLQARVPGMRENVPPVANQLGENVASTSTGLRALDPTRASPERDAPLTRAFIDAGVDVGTPPKTLDGVDLTPEEQRRYQQMMGETLQQRAGRIVEGGAWVNRSPASKAAYLQAAYDSARDVAGVRLQRELGTDFSRRRRDAVLVKKAG